MHGADLSHTRGAREYIQRFAGYCLLGNHPEKKLLLLTDVRDDYNGKSTFQKALSVVLGPEYSIVGEHNVPKWTATTTLLIVTMVGHFYLGTCGSCVLKS